MNELYKINKPYVKFCSNLIADLLENDVRGALGGDTDLEV